MEYFKVIYFIENHFYEVLQPFIEVLHIKEWEMKRQWDYWSILRVLCLWKLYFYNYKMVYDLTLKSGKSNAVYMIVFIYVSHVMFPFPTHYFFLNYTHIINYNWKINYFVSIEKSQSYIYILLDFYWKFYLVLSPLSPALVTWLLEKT